MDINFLVRTFHWPSRGTETPANLKETDQHFTANINADKQNNSIDEPQQKRRLETVSNRLLGSLARLTNGQHSP